MIPPNRLRKLHQFDQKLRHQRRLDLSGLAGVDEVGRGPLAGPVVACALFLQHPRFSVRVDDSKRLSACARAKAFEAIVREAELGIGWVGPEQIDRIGIGRASDLAMLQAIIRLPRVPQLVMVDGKRVPSAVSAPAIPVVRGDGRSLRIACASIVAKVIRDRWMERLDRFHPEYGFLKHKGYGTPQHLQALRWMGPSRFHRFSFRPIRPEADA